MTLIKYTRNQLYQLAPRRRWSMTKWTCRVERSLGLCLLMLQIFSNTNSTIRKIPTKKENYYNPAIEKSGPEVEGTVNTTMETPCGFLRRQRAIGVPCPDVSLELAACFWGNPGCIDPRLSAGVFLRVEKGRSFETHLRSTCLQHS